METEKTPALNPGQYQDRVEFFENRLLDYSEAAKYLSVSESYLRKLKLRRQIPFVPLGNRAIRFRVGSLNNWIEKREMK